MALTGGHVVGDPTHTSDHNLIDAALAVTVRTVNSVAPDGAGNVVVAGGGGAVTSVAARTGAVVLTTADVGGLGTAATQAIAAFDAAGAATTVSAASLQKANNLFDLANAVTARTNLGLGTAAVEAKVAAGAVGVLNALDASTTNARVPSGAAGGGLAGTYPNPTVNAIATPGGLSATGTPSVSTFLRGDGAWQPAPVATVAGRTGAVVIALADVAGAINAAGAPVQTVAGRAGAVVLTVADVSGAAPVVESVNTVATSGATQTIPDVTTSTTSRIVLTAACTFTFPTLAAGKSFTVTLVQDATGGRTAVWPASVLWSGGTAPALTAAANKRDVFTFVAQDATNWLGFTAGLNF